MAYRIIKQLSEVRHTMTQQCQAAPRALRFRMLVTSSGPVFKAVQTPMSVLVQSHTNRINITIKYSLTLVLKVQCVVQNGKQSKSVSRLLALAGESILQYYQGWANRNYCPPAQCPKFRSLKIGDLPETFTLFLVLHAAYNYYFLKFLRGD